MATLYMLDMDMHFNPIKNSTPFGGLTIVEWLHRYGVLEECYAGGLSAPPDGILEIDAKEFPGTLQRAALSLAKAQTFLERATFQAGRRDLYDAPLLQTCGGRLFVLAALYRGIDVALIVSSQIGSQKLNVDSKGKAFEKAVLKIFADAGLIARTFKLGIGSTNTSVPSPSYGTDTCSFSNARTTVFRLTIRQSVFSSGKGRWRQCNKLRGLRRTCANIPRSAASSSEATASWQQIHAVVLNAPFLSFSKNRKGTFSYDVPALGRFLKEGTLNEIHSVPVVVSEWTYQWKLSDFGRDPSLLLLPPPGDERTKPSYISN